MYGNKLKYAQKVFKLTTFWEINTYKLQVVMIYKNKQIDCKSHELN